jgi:hypothetical protein
VDELWQLVGTISAVTHSRDLLIVSTLLSDSSESRMYLAEVEAETRPGKATPRGPVASFAFTAVLHVLHGRSEVVC